jgi:hypothetical protein
VVTGNAETEMLKPSDRSRDWLCRSSWRSSMRQVALMASMVLRTVTPACAASGSCPQPSPRFPHPEFDDDQGGEHAADVEEGLIIREGLEHFSLLQLQVFAQSVIVS